MHIAPTSSHHPHAVSRASSDRGHLGQNWTKPAAKRSHAEFLARILVYAVFLYSCVEGLVINIFYPSLLPYIYKDFMLVLIYGLVFLTRPDRLVPPSLRGLAIAIGLLLAVSLAYLAIPDVSAMVGLIGLKQKLFYIPLIGVGYFFVRSAAGARQFLIMLLLSGILVSAFGIYLHFTGPAGLWRLGGHYSAVIHTADTGKADTYWRVPGPFTSPGQFGAYLFFNGLIATAVLLAPWISFRWRLIAGFTLMMLVSAVFVTGSRAPIILLAGSILVVVMLSISVPRIVLAAGAVSLAGLIGLVQMGSGIHARFATIADHEHVDRFQRTYFAQLFLPQLLENPIGSGLGSATIGARHFADFDDLIFVESYFGIFAIEMGVPGLLAILSVCGAIALAVIRAWQPMRNSPLMTIWSALAAYVVVTIAIMPVSTSLDHGPTNLYFWFSIGVLIRLVDLERHRKRICAATTSRDQPVRAPARLLQAEYAS